VDTGHFVLYDVRASTPVSSALISNGVRWPFRINTTYHKILPNTVNR
jgi:hypothetical protein